MFLWFDKDQCGLWAGHCRLLMACLRLGKETTNASGIHMP